MHSGVLWIGLALFFAGCADADGGGGPGGEAGLLDGATADADDRDAALTPDLDRGAASARTPRVAVEPASFLFPSVADGAVARDVRVSNVGDAALTLLEFNRSDFDQAQFTLSWWANDDEASASERFPVSIRVDPGRWITLRLTRSAGSEGEPFGRVAFRTNELGTPEVSLRVGAEGSSGPQLRVSPAAVDFGTVLPGVAADEVVTLTSVGAERLMLTAIQVEGAAGFAVALDGVWLHDDASPLDDPDGDGAPGLDVNQSARLLVRFEPQGNAPASAELLIRSSDARQPELRVPLSGNGRPDGAGCLSPSPEVIQFAQVAVGELERAELTLTRCSAAPVTITAVRLSDDSADVYRLLDPLQLPFQLPGAEAGEPAEVVVGVQFAPEAQGAFGGTLVIDSDAPDTPRLEVPIVGRSAP